MTVLVLADHSTTSGRWLGDDGRGEQHLTAVKIDEQLPVVGRRKQGLATGLAAVARDFRAGTDESDARRLGAGRLGCIVPDQKGH